MKIFICGSSGLIKKNYQLKDKIYFQKQINLDFYQKPLNTMQMLQFFIKYLGNIINKLNIQGIIIYSMFSTLIEPITEIARDSKIFVINDGGENIL